MSDHTVAEDGYQERDACAALADLGQRVEAMPGHGKSQTHLRKSDVLDLVREVDREWFAQTVARKGSALAKAVEAALTEGDEAVRIWHTQYSGVRAECDALRARIEALCDDADRYYARLQHGGQRGLVSTVTLRSALEAKP